MDKNNIAKIPPQNLEAEQYFLGCLLLDKEAFTKIDNSIHEKDFYKDAHGTIYEIMKELYSKNEPIDIVSLTNRLEERNKLKDIGGRTYLAHLSTIAPTASHIVHYSEIIKKKSILRNLLGAANKIAELGHKEEEEIDKLLDEAESNLFSVSQVYQKNVFVPVNTLLKEAFNRIDELHGQDNTLRGIPTDFTDLDALLSGLQRSDLVIIAARPSVGKTAFVLDVARKTAVRYKTSVGIFSLEMSKEQLVDRMLCAQANISLWKMRTGKLSEKGEDDDFSKINEGMGQLADAPIYIDDTPNCSIMEIRSKARRLQAEHGLDIIIVDYLQLMEGRGTYRDNRVQEVAEITRGLKGIARELNVPVIALSQLSRAVENTKPAIPKLAHLRESGSIEQDADIVMFIYRKAVDRNYNFEELSPEDKSKAEIHIAKHRNGPTGKIDLFFDGEHVSYKNMSKIGNE